MKKLIFCVLVLFISAVCFAQTKESDAVKVVLKKYNTAIEKLDTAGITDLFVKNSSIFEGGSSEGTIGHYLEHHLGPELKEFKSFTFSDYKAEVTIGGEYAFTTETYLYTIVLQKDAKEIKSKGVATSVLRKGKAGWKFVTVHTSFRRMK